MISRNPIDACDHGALGPGAVAIDARTATSVTPFATPNVFPPAVPATCVPCPAKIDWRGRRWAAITPRRYEVVARDRTELPSGFAELVVREPHPRVDDVHLHARAPCCWRSSCRPRAGRAGRRDRAPTSHLAAGLGALDHGALIELDELILLDILHEWVMRQAGRGRVGEPDQEAAQRWVYVKTIAPPWAWAIACAVPGMSRTDGFSRTMYWPGMRLPPGR